MLGVSNGSECSIAGLAAMAVGLGLLLTGCDGSGTPSSGGGRASQGRDPGTASTPQAAASPASGEESSGGEPAPDDRYALGFTMHRIDGAEEPLEAYRGRVVMVVNVASACGLTPQYEGLEALYEQHAGDGLVILGFPANNFGGQEPGTNDEIAEFCTGEYGVTFPMFEKISVTGDDQHPLYATLSREGGPPTWNFTKYLLDREGRVVARFDPRTAPNDEALVGRIEELLAQQ